MTRADFAPIGRDTTLDEAFRAAHAERWGVSREALADALRRAVNARFQDPDADPAGVESFVLGLHLDDLALACACAQGLDTAWDHFVTTYRPELCRAARAISGESSGRELADSLYADLFGLSDQRGVRRSLFRYYHGRAKLSTWLRSVLAQRHVDMARARRRLTSLDDPEHPQPEPVAPAQGVEPDEAGRMRTAARAISAALPQLEPQDRLRLAYYYVHGLTLAEAGRLLGEHEATASRKLEKARKALRQGIESALTARGGRVDEIESWAAVARLAWDAALADALGVDAPVAPQAGGSPPFKEKRTP